MMNKEEEFVEKIKSKNWKERQEAYVELGQIWKKSDDYSHLVLYLQNEANLPALESAIEAILSLKMPPKIEVVSKIFTHIGNSKTTIKNKIISLVLYLAQDHLEDLITELCGILNSKTPKNVSNSINCLVEITKKFDVRLNLVGDKLSGIFAHTDKNVRSEGVRLSIELYKQHGDEIRKYLNSLKPIQMKELEEEFSKFKIEEKDEPVCENKISVSSSLLKRMDDEKWNVRLEALNELKTNIKAIELSNDLMSSLFRKINDPNNQVLFSTLDIYSIIKPKNQRIINSLVERLKDKKPIVTDKIKQTLIQMKLNPENIPIDFFKHKNPQIKYNIVDYCILAKMSHETIVKAILTCLSDSSCEVRTIALKALNVLEYNRNILPEQIRNKLNTSTPVVKKESFDNAEHKSTCKSIGNASFRRNEPVKKASGLTQQINENNYFGPTDGEKKEVLERFYVKYPFFNEKMWNLRLEEFKTHYKYLLKEDIKDLAIFFFANKEANFHLNLEFMDLMIKRKAELNHVKNTVMLYCLEKITEIKLKNKILEVFQCLNRRDTVLFLVNEVENLKQGKKFCSILTLLSKLIRKGDIEVERIFYKQIIGLQEKKIFEELRAVYKNLGEETSIHENESEEDQQIEEIFKEVPESILFIDDNEQKDKRDDAKSPAIMPENVFEDKSKPNKNILQDSFKEIKSYIQTEIIKKMDKDEIIADSNVKVSEFSKLETDSPKIIFSTKKKIFNDIKVLRSDIPRNRVKGKGSFEDVFTREFVKILKTEDFNLVIDYFEKIDMVIVSDHIINYYVQQKLSSTFFNSLILHFISKKYILAEIECRVLLTHLLETEMNEELEMIDRIYPVTKLFIILQKIRTEKAINEILRLISKYNIFRGNKKMFIDELKKNNRQALKSTLEGCPDFLSFINEIEENFKASTTFSRIEDKDTKVLNDVFSTQENFVKISTDNPTIQSHKLKNLTEDISQGPVLSKKIILENIDSYVPSGPLKGTQIDDKKETFHDLSRNLNYQTVRERSFVGNLENKCRSPQVNTHNTLQNNFEEIILRNKIKETFEKQDLIAPSVLDDSFNIDDVDIENSLDCLSISSNLGVSTPNLKKFRKEFFTPVKKRDSIESLESILDNLIDSNQEKSEQAFKKLSDLIKNNISSVLFSANSIMSSISIQLLDVLYRPLYATLILNVLLKLSQSKLFCEQLRKETLENVNIDLFNMMNSLNKGNKKENISLIPLVGDIITNLCINSKPSISLEVYLNILTEKREEISLKLIWRHSKALIMRNKEEIQNIIDLFESFYSKNVYSIILNDNTTFKVLTLHIKEIVNYYSTEIYKFEIGKFTKILVDFFIQKKDISVKEFRYRIENNCNI